MKKGLWVIIILIVVAVLAYLYFIPETSNVKEEPTLEEETETEVMELEGEISEIDSEQVALDGPTVITVVRDNGTSGTIEVPSMGINLCAARSTIADVFALEVGQRIEVRGSVTPDGAIVPCESGDHYLRVVEEE